MSVTLKTALKHVLQLPVIEVMEDKQPHCFCSESWKINVIDVCVYKECDMVSGSLTNMETILVLGWNEISLILFSLLTHTSCVTLISVSLISPLPGFSEGWARLCSPLHLSPLLLDGCLVQPSGWYFREAPRLSLSSLALPLVPLWCRSLLWFPLLSPVCKDKDKKRERTRERKLECCNQAAGQQHGCSNWRWLSCCWWLKFHMSTC